MSIENFPWREVGLIRMKDIGNIFIKNSLSVNQIILWKTFFEARLGSTQH